MEKKPAFDQMNLSGMAAFSAGLLYISRWIWELWEGILKNMNSPSLITQYFFIVKLLFLLGLIGIYRNITDKKARIALIVACIGIVWTAVTRTIEANGVSGPWGLFGSPGLLLFFIGLSVAGFSLISKPGSAILGKLLIYICTFSILGSVSAILLFNVLGRDIGANETASVVSNVFLIAEGFGWIVLGLKLRSSTFDAKLHKN